MYRAKVEQVSGTRVRAGGKWLTCIGNKKVRVGDWVYTDGRCVYCYEKESQAPLVITPISDKDFIPFSLYDTTCTSLYKLQEKSRTTFSDYSGERVFFVNDTKGRFYIFLDRYFDNRRYFAANCDDNGDVYCLLQESENVLVKKINKLQETDETIATINIIDIFSDSIDLAMQRAQNAGYPKESEDFNYVVYDIVYLPCWGFIENEKNWAFVVTSFITGSWAYQEYWRNATSANIYDTFYCDSNGTTKIICRDSNIVIGRTTKEQNTGKLETINIKFPCQENYYFTIKSTNHPDVGEYTIYSPEDKKLFSFISWLFSSITILKISNQKYLFGVGRSAVDSIIRGYGVGDVDAPDFFGDPVFKAIITDNKYFTTKSQMFLYEANKGISAIGESQINSLWLKEVRSKSQNWIRSETYFATYEDSLSEE